MSRLFCLLGKCLQCMTFETAEGIGGKCIKCGKVHGWTTHEELRRYADEEFNHRVKQAA